jgi:hypothetical protein
VTAAAATVAVAVSLVGVLAAQQDSILLQNGGRLRGVSIDAMRLAGIRFHQGTAERALPWRDFAAVEWGAAPDVFVAAEGAVRRRDYAAARQLYGEAMRRTDRPAFVADVQLRQARAAAAAATDAASAATAAAALQQWLAGNSEHAGAPTAMLLAARMLRLTKAWTEAAAVLRQLEACQQRFELGPVWAARGKGEDARLQLDQGDAAAAQAGFLAMADAAAGPGMPDEAAELAVLRREAAVGVGEALLAAGAWDAATAHWRTVANSGVDADLAAAKAGEGEVLLARFGDGSHPVETRRAQLLLAEASVTGTDDTAAKAGFLLGRCLVALGTAGAGEAFRSRARDYWSRVVREHGDSRWAVAAAAALRP